MSDYLDKWEVTWLSDAVVSTIEVPMWYFYVLQSLQNPDYFYKGSTDDLRLRLQQHNNKETDSIRPYLPFRLVYYEAYLSERTARKREASVKHSGSVSIPLLRRIKENIEEIR